MDHRRTNRQRGFHELTTDHRPPETKGGPPTTDHGQLKTKESFFDYL
ncbi:MAG: hypothetical protein AVDCRST_MAG93-9331 [uncultured Chloroflexia bacterium]|uniref:Uncharacterized protein n=1 Tax=uncultured Chloroflexia bacterium TaxID=1672391 RepID=A0A6J4NG38_9CHLR|nr:MAG: hypothetical protein AVDCRST_MAG93-9331 [uncultured Chloroflexia bacterium]